MRIKWQNAIDPINLPVASRTPPGNDYYPENRDVLVYQTNPTISEKFETAFIKFCRFSRLLAVRANMHRASLADIRAINGDSVIWHALRVLQVYGFDVNLSQEVMETLDGYEFDHTLLLSMEQARRFGQYISTNGFTSFPKLLTKVFSVEERRREVVRFNVTENVRTLQYLVNYYRMWKVTYEGTKIMERRFGRSIPRVHSENRDDYDQCRFKDPEKLCTICNKNVYTSGRGGRLCCGECDFFCLVIETLRRTKKSVTLLPINFQWQNMQCYEPMPFESTNVSPVFRRARSSSVPRALPTTWTMSKAKRFIREVARKRRYHRRQAPSVSEESNPTTVESEQPSAALSASLETLPGSDDQPPYETDDDISSASTSFNQVYFPGVTSTTNDFPLNYDQLNPSLADIRKKVTDIKHCDWNAVEMYKYYSYLQSKARLLCFGDNPSQSSVEISNTYAKVFCDVDAGLYAWAGYAVQSGDIPLVAKHPWVVEGDNKYCAKNFVMPPEYIEAARVYNDKKEIEQTLIQQFQFNSCFLKNVLF